MQVVMIGHEAVGVTYPVVAFIDVIIRVQKVLVVLLIFEDGFLFVATRCYMADCTGIFYTKRSDHKTTIAQ
jgi:hypothetical protein